MVSVDCPYKDACTSYRTPKCSMCRHNRKRDYFEPARPDWKKDLPWNHPWRVWCYEGASERAYYGQVR